MKYLRLLLTKQEDFKPLSETDYSIPHNESKVLMIPITSFIETNVLANGWEIADIKLVDDRPDILKGE